MKILSQITNNPIPNTDSSLAIKEGEVYSAKIRERLPNNEAVVQIKGKDVKVQFEGEVPQKDQVLVQVSNKSGELPVVKTVTSPTQGQSGIVDINRVLSSLGLSNPSPELKEALQAFLDKGMPITKEAVRALQVFLEGAPGSPQQKLDTIKALLAKNIDMTLPHLQAVHEALHGKPLGRALQDIEKVNNGQRSGLVEQALMQLKNMIQSGSQTITQGQFHPASKSQMEAMLQEMSKLLKGVESEINELPAQLKETVGQEKLLATLSKVNEGFAANLANLSQPIEGYNQASELQASMQITSKDLIVTEITKRLAAATDQFKTLKKEATRNLDHLIQMVEATRSQAIHHTRPLLESTIDILDKAILKSEITSLTDMQTEKKLMSASSDLAKARAFLEKGEHTEATRILREVKDLLQNMNWKPSDVKVKHFITSEALFMEDKPAVHKLSNLFEHTSRMLSIEPHSARSTYEMFRALGFNHDSEVAQKLISHKEGQMNPNQSHQGNQDGTERNLKALILQSLKEADTRNQSTAQPLQQALQHITGQQLLSKADGPTQLQSMFFNLPIAQGSELKDIKVYINSKQSGEKVDWENCSLYFLFETKKIGDTGILISSTNRNLSITIKNDLSQLKEKLSPLVESCKEKLKEIGYHISGVSFAPLTPIEKGSTEVAKVGQKVSSRHATEPDLLTSGSKVPRFDQTAKKGFDFKV